MKPERQKEVDRQLQMKNNCCQVVLGAFCEDFGFSQEQLLPLAGGLGGGMSHHAEYRQAIIARLGGGSV